MSAMALMLAMQVFFGGAECKVEYKLMESETWFLLDDSGLEQYTHTQGVQYGEGDEA